MVGKQTAFTSPIDRTREILERAERQLDDHNVVNLAVSGGTDSIVAADVMCRIGPEYGFTPDAVTHINTGASVPQSRLAAKIIAAKYDLEFIEQGPRNQRNALAVRVLRNGWPGAFTGRVTDLGHSREWGNRKNKPMDEVYMRWDGHEVWVSGARKLESKRRSGTVADGAIDSDKPRRTWIQPIVGWTSAEKRDYVKEHFLPVSQAYLIMGFSAECVACSFDDTGLLTDLDLLAPELAHAIRSLAVWLGMLAVRGDVDVDAKQLCWGWEPGDNTTREDIERNLETPTEYRYFEVDDGRDGGLKVRPSEGVMLPTEVKTQELVGCTAGSCSKRNAPNWIADLPPEQIVDREDTLTAWNGAFDDVAARFA